MMNTFPSILFALAALAASPVWSQAAAPHDHAHGQAGAANAALVTDGEVRKVDKTGAKVTIKHGEIKALNMPPMTMVYPVTNPAMLDKVKAGDKVKFTADKVGAQLRVTSIEVQR